jgi:ABC-type nitrate/sulfonate/bicarbonate transport system substrate-binding protein
MDIFCRAYNVHEVLVHRVAEEAGLYREAGIEVTLTDGTGPKAQELERTVPVTVGLGGSLHSRLLHGTDWVVVSVNTQHPLFWLVSQASVHRIADLRGKRVAGRRRGQPPGTFASLIFRQHGMDLWQDCSYVPIDDYESGVQMLERGEVEATVVNAPPFALERAGFRMLAFFGTEFPFPSTGLAVNQGLLAADAPEVQSLVAATRRALERLHADRELTIRAIQSLEGDASREDAALQYDRYIHPYFSHDGRPDRQLAETSLREIARELGAERPPTFDEFYKVP